MFILVFKSRIIGKYLVNSFAWNKKRIVNLFTTHFLILERKRKTTFTFIFRLSESSTKAKILSVRGHHSSCQPTPSPAHDLTNSAGAVVINWTDHPAHPNTTKRIKYWGRRSPGSGSLRKLKLLGRRFYWGQRGQRGLVTRWVVDMDCRWRSSSDTY